MKKYILYDKEGNVKSICDGCIEFDKNIFTLKEIEITNEEHEKIKQNYILKFKDDKLEFEKTPDMISKEDKENKKKIFMDEVENAKTITDIKNILNKLI